MNDTPLASIESPAELRALPADALPDVAQALREQCLPLTMQPQDICGLVLFLASDDARAITKQVFVADAGRS